MPIGGYIETVVVIGGGISGLACGYRLKQLGIHCIVLEAERRAGGLVATIHRDGFLFESGPQCPRFPASVWGLVHDLKLDSEFVAGNPKAKRFIFHDGRMHPAPFSPASLITTSLVELASKLRILTEGLRSTHAPAHEESLAEFVERKFGADVLNNLIDPIVSTVFCGDSQKMGMESAFPTLVEWERKHGSLVRGAIAARKSKRSMPAMAASLPGRVRKRDSLRVTDALPSLGSFVTGMAALPAALSRELKEQIRYGVPVASISPSSTENGEKNGLWQIDLSDGGRIYGEHVVLAVPAYIAAEFLQRSVPQLASDLRDVEYAPACVVSCVYGRSQVANPLDGFGFMVPRQEGLHTICTFWNSSLFRGRAPEGKVLITSFAGAAKGDDFMSISKEECARIVERENARILGIAGESIDRLVWRASQALPQYNVGHKQRISRIYSGLGNAPNLFIVGNFLKGRSLGDCVDVAFQVAEGLDSQFQQKNI